MQDNHPLQSSSEQVRFHHVSDLAANYKAWLATFAHQNNSDNDRKKIDAYKADALNTVKFRGQELSPFAPVLRKYSALQRVTIGQELVIGFLLLGLVLGLLFYRIEMIVA